MSKPFTGQVALVSGGAEGLGKSIALRIAQGGAKIVLVDINKQLLLSTVEEFNANGYEVLSIAADVSDETAVRNAMDETEERFGQLDIVVNAAGIVGPTNTPITEYPADAYDKIYNVNLKGSFLITKYAVKKMEKTHYGRILLIASIAGKEGNPFMVGYSSMKAGVIGLVKAVGKEYADKGITVNGLAPAVIKTAMNENTAPEQLEYMLSKIPMKRLGTVEEVASIAAWIVSPEASFTTGFIFDISGGRATY